MRKKSIHFYTLGCRSNRPTSLDVFRLRFSVTHNSFTSSHPLPALHSRFSLTFIHFSSLSQMNWFTHHIFSACHFIYSLFFHWNKGFVCWLMHYGAHAGTQLKRFTRSGIRKWIPQMRKRKLTRTHTFRFNTLPNRHQPSALVTVKPLYANSYCAFRTAKYYV